MLIIIYWLNNARRVWFKKRLGRDIQLSLKTIAQNIAIMLKPQNNFKLAGRIESLKNGAILYSVHFGVWELMPKILKNFLNKKVGILVDRYTDNNPILIGKIMDRLLYLIRSKNNTIIFYPDEVFKITKFIKDGGIFSALVDGDKIFARLPKMEKLARICNIPLIPFAVYYEKGNTVMEIGCDLDKIISQKPYDYWWFYKSRRR
uniref:Lipid A biosynthesis acyltransferase n=1 Tax=candidate division WOR-3 bacterium TaxID=2052148 RepID=A0A7V0Z4E2_UNCW3